MKQNAIIFSTIFYLTGTLALYDLTPEEVEMVFGLHQACIDSTSVTRELVEKTKRGVWINNSEVKEFSYCMVTKLSIMSEDGKVLPGNMRHLIKDELGASDEEAENLVKECGVQKNDKMETAFLLAKCVSDTYKKNF